MQLVRNKIAESIQGEFAQEINRLVYEEARHFCECCEMDDPSQLHHECMMTDMEELWIRHYESAKEHLNVNKLWTVIEKEIFTKLDVYLQDSWLKYILIFLKWMKLQPFYCIKMLNEKMRAKMNV